MLQIQTIGYLGKDATVAQWDGKSVINFSVAHTEKYNSKHGTSEVTHWVECSFWSDSEVWKYLKKGTQVFIQGAQTVNLYDMPSGDKNFRINCRISKIEIISSKETPADDLKEQPTKTTKK
jgi:single-strand DNA-binding protein